jgi:hypothetical protein
VYYLLYHFLDEMDEMEMWSEMTDSLSQASRHGAMLSWNGTRINRNIESPTAGAESLNFDRQQQ